MNKIIFIGLIIGLLLLNACDSNKTQIDTTKTYLGGNEGVDVSFASGAPPKTVSDAGGEQTFDIIVELLNKGEYTIPVGDAQVSIVGFPPEAFGVTNQDLVKTNQEEISSRKKNPDGSITEPPTYYVTFEGLQYQYTEPGNQEFPIQAEVCYNYETNVASTLCILEELTSTNTNNICQVNSIRGLSSSGAPVQVTKITESTAGKNKIRFTFTLQNIGSGEIYKTRSLCEDRTQYKDKVYVQVENLLNRGADSISCTGLTQINEERNAGYVTLPKTETRDVSCTVTMNERTDRVQPFNIKLVYDYLEVANTQITVLYTPTN